MTTKTMKSALSESLKAEEKKVMATKSPPTQKASSPKPKSAPKPSPAPKPKAAPKPKPAAQPKPGAAAKPAVAKPVAPAKPVVAAKPAPAANSTTPKAAKPAPAPAPATAPAVSATPKVDKPAKSAAKKNLVEKVIRDSFTMPEQDYGLIAELKRKAHELGVSIKKSELLRAGLRALADLPQDHLKARVEKLEKVKTGRPKGKAGKK